MSMSEAEERVSQICASGYSLEIMGGLQYGKEEGWSAYVKHGNTVVKWVAGESLADIIQIAHEWTKQNARELQAQGSSL
jgi:hypothetical protein